MRLQTGSHAGKDGSRMRITAVAVGTRGDVNPLADLGEEMIRRGYDFRILAQESFGA